MLKSLGVIILSVFFLSNCTAVSDAEDLPEKTIEPPKAEIPVSPQRQAQRPYGMPVQIPISVICNDSKVIHSYIKEQHGEMVVAYGFKETKMNIAQIVVQIYVNPKTRKFTIVQHGIKGISCVILNGTDFDINFKYAPIVSATPINIAGTPAGQNVTVVVNKISQSRIEGVVRFNASGDLSLAVHLIAIGIPN